MMIAQKGRLPAPLWVIAHRGASAVAQENTAAAFREALRFPIDGIELDVQLSQDQIPVLYHDRTLKKVIGRRRYIHDFSLRALRQRCPGLDLLTLSQTIQRFSPKTRLLIEIKSHRRDQKLGISSALTNVVADLIKPMKQSLRNQQICVLSFDPDVLEQIKQRVPSCPLVLNVRKADHRALEAYPSYLFALCLAVRRLTPPYARAAHRRGFKVMTYACNVAAQVKKAFACHADAIMTDHPQWLCEYLRKSANDRRS